MEIAISNLMTGPLFDWLALLLALAIFAAYEVHLHVTSRTRPMRMARSAHAEIRARWVDSVIGRQGSEIQVIQTLRNSLMAASFMASTAVLALIGTLTLSGIATTRGAGAQLADAGVQHDLLQLVKLLLICASFMASLLYSAMSVRYFNHTGYLITGVTEDSDLAEARSLAKTYINRAGHYYSLGVRAFFLCLPFMTALFSSYFAPPTMLILVILFWQFDRINATGV